jgi:hypothetical protein
MKRRGKNNNTNNDFKSKSLEELMEESSLKTIQNEDTKKWNFLKKEDNTIVSEVWFDKIMHGTSFSRIIGYEHNTLTLSGIVYLEVPIKTEGAYPFSVYGRFYNYTSEGEFIGISEGHCGLSGI